MAKKVKLVNLGRVIRKHVKADSALEYKAMGFELLGELTKKTPYKTGRARANWTISTNAPDYETHDGTQPRPIPKINTKDFPSIYLSNGLPYVVELEDNRSQQTSGAGIITPAIAAARAKRR